ncbi:MAG: hypothetical protein QOE83_598 [Actinomycetota bacterium]|jgi:hypothetical protein|nr:hypothetical protein [Actinomycetota bacterium]
MSENSIQGGKSPFDTVWLRCQAAASFKQDEALITIRALDLPDPNPSFFVDANLLEPGVSLTKNAEVQSRVHVLLIAQNNGRATVEVPGEPISFGPKVVVPSDDLA